MKTKGIVSIIIKCVLGLVGLTLLVLILGRESFFTDDSFFYSLFDEDFYKDLGFKQTLS